MLGKDSGSDMSRPFPFAGVISERDGTLKRAEKRMADLMDKISLTWVVDRTD